MASSGSLWPCGNASTPDARRPQLAGQELHFDSRATRCARSPCGGPRRLTQEASSMSAVKSRRSRGGCASPCRRGRRPASSTCPPRWPGNSSAMSKCFRPWRWNSRGEAGGAAEEVLPFAHHAIRQRQGGQHVEHLHLEARVGQGRNHPAARQLPDDHPRLLCSLHVGGWKQGPDGNRRTAGEAGRSACHSKLPRFSPGLRPDNFHSSALSASAVDCKTEERGGLRKC